MICSSFIGRYYMILPKMKYTNQLFSFLTYGQYLTCNNLLSMMMAIFAVIINWYSYMIHLLLQYAFVSFSYIWIMRAMVWRRMENSPFLGSGSNGPQRACFTGSTGPTGPTGPTGSTGSTGSRGRGAEWTHHPFWCWRYTLHSSGKINNGTGNIDSHPA